MEAPSREDAAPPDEYSPDETPRPAGAPVPAAGDGSRRARRRRRREVPGALVAAVVGVALVPIGMAAGRAVSREWRPVGDDALFPIRARDVFTLDHIPLLGTWSSASLNVGTDINHPGPLLFDLLALPVRLLGGGTGTAVGIAVVNGLALVGIAVFAGRRAGPLVALAATMAAATLAWAMGSELLYEPWGPYSMLLPFLLFLVLAWSVAGGDLVALPFAAVAGSLVVQTHLSYSFLVPAIGALALLGLWRARRREGGGGGRILRWSLVGLLVLALCWTQPLIEQFTGDGEGNISRLVSTGTSSDTEAVGYGRSTRIVAKVVSVPPFWMRPSVRDAFLSSGRDPDDDPDLGLAELPSDGVAGASLLGLLALLGLGWWWGHRRGDRAAQRAVVLAGAGVGVAVLTAARTPVTSFGVAPHQFIWLWPLAAFVTFALVLSLVVPAVRTTRTGGRWLAGALVAGVLAITVLDVPESQQGIGPNLDLWSLPAIRDVSSQLDRLEGAGPLLVDDLAGYKRFASPYENAILAELQRRDVEFVTSEVGLLRQIGDGRRSTGQAEAELLLTIGPEPEVPDGAERVAHHDGLDGPEQEELARRELEAVDVVRRGELRLNEAGRAALREGRLPALADYTPGTDPRGVLVTGTLAVLVDDDLLDVHGRTAAVVERYVELARQRDRETISVWLRPTGDAGRG